MAPLSEALQPRLRLRSCRGGGGQCCPASRSGRAPSLLSLPGSGVDGCMHKLRDLLSEDLRLVQWNKGARVGEKLQGRVRKGLLETSGKAR